MEPSELNEAELLALVGLCKVLVRADGAFSDSEQQALSSLGDQVGSARWGSALQAASAALRSAADLDAALEAVEREDARVLIHEQLESLAGSDGLTEREAAVLDRVARLWDLGLEAPMAPKFLSNK